MTKLNLGSGNLPLQGYINHDLVKHRPEIDITFDLNDPDWYLKVWDVYGNEIKEIRAWDVIEHLSDPINFLNQCWEILPKDGELKLKACGWHNPNYWVDITHKKGYDLLSFDYLDPTTNLGKEYGYYTLKKWQIKEKGLDRNQNIIIKLSPIK
jgi:hypothetical protein